MPNYYYSDCGGYQWLKQIRPNAYMCVTFYSDCDLPEITFPDSLPARSRETTAANFDAKYAEALSKIKEAKDE